MTELNLSGRATRNAAVDTERLLPPVVLPEPQEQETGWSPSEWRNRAAAEESDESDQD